MSVHKIRGSTAAAIAHSLEKGIYDGTFGPDAALPSIRGLAESLAVSPGTVAAAYRRLQQRGMVVGRGRQGTRVRRALPVGRMLTPPLHASGAGVRVPPGSVAIAEGDLSTGEPDPELLPPLDGVPGRVRFHHEAYAGAALFEPLRAFAVEEFTADGVPAGPLAASNGGLDAVERLLRDHLRPGDRVAVEDPTLPVLLDLIGASGWTPEPVAVDDAGPHPAALEAALGRGVRAVVMTLRGQNPTGAAVTAARAATLGALLRRRDDVLAVESDPLGPVAGVPLVSVAAAGLQRWAHVRSVTKFLGPDLRLALITGDPLTLGRFVTRQALSVRWVSRLLQRVAIAVWSDPGMGRRLARAADVYALRRTALVEELASLGIAVASRSGFNVWVPVREEASVVQALAERGWQVAAGERFRVRCPPGIRITTARLAPGAARRFSTDLVTVLDTTRHAAV